MVIVGAGFSGLYQLHVLRQRGYAVHLVEANGGPGGVWYANRYPGVRVDSHVPNYEYSIEEVWRDWIWSERFPGGEEICRYFRHVDNVLGLSADISYDTRVTAASYDEGADAWSIDLEDGATMTARHLILCTGFATKPYIPDLPGLANFEGPCHHTARWPSRGVALDGRRVGVIGTGASGVQVVQEAAKVATKLVVFQRTAVTALPMQQRKLDPDHERRAKQYLADVFARRNNPPGSLHDIERRGESALAVSEEERVTVYRDAWNEGGFHFWGGTFADVAVDEEANRTAYDFWRDETRARVHDPVTAEILAPTDPPYPFGTKRPALEQDYYDCFNQPNVELVDLRTSPITEITARGVRCADAHHELDVLVLATGFDANTGGLTAIDVRDTRGRSLADRWADGVDTTLGLAVSGFPNLFFLYGPQSPTAFCNGPTCAERQGDWLADLLDHLRACGVTRIEPRPGADQAWTEHVDAVGAAMLLSRTDSWYMAANIPGKRRQLLNYPSSDAYLEALADCAAAGYDRFVLR